MHKEKLTFVYNNGTTYTTKRNVTDYISCHPGEFIYSVEAEKQGSVQCRKTYIVQCSELIAVIAHGNDKFGTPTRVYKMTKKAGVKVEITHPWKDYDNSGTMFHVV